MCGSRQRLIRKLERSKCLLEINSKKFWRRGGIRTPGTSVSSYNGFAISPPHRQVCGGKDLCSGEMPCFGEKHPYGDAIVRLCNQRSTIDEDIPTFSHIGGKHKFASLFESDPAPRLFLRCRVDFLSHEPGLDNFCVSNFFRMTFVGQSENILVHDDKVP